MAKKLDRALASGVTLVLLAAAIAGCSSGDHHAAPPPASAVDGHLRLNEEVVLGTFEGSFDGVNFEVHPMGAPEIVGTRAQLPALVGLDAGSFGSTVTPSGTNFVAMKQIGGSMRIGGTNPWDTLNCGAAPTSGTCVQMSMQNMFAQYELIHPYAQFTDITPGVMGTPITFNTNAATDGVYGVSSSPGLVRYPDRIAPAGTVGLDSAIKYWVFSSTSAPPLAFSFHFNVLARLADPIIRASLVSGTSDLTPTYGGGTSGGSNNGTGAFPAMGPVRIDVSTDGRYTVFQSQNDLASTGTATLQVYLRDNVAGTTALVSRTSTGGLPSSVLPAGCQSSTPAMAASGGYVAFLSRCRLDPRDTDNNADVYLYNVSAGTSKLVSVDATGANSAVAAGGNSIVGVSDDGNRVAFAVAGSMLDQFGSTCTGQLWVYDDTAGISARISVLGGGDPTCATGTSNQPVMDQLGDFVAYSSTATNLVAGDTNACADVFLYDINGDATARVSLNQAGAQLTGTCASNNPAISSDATHVAWDTQANNILSANGTSKHVYVVTVGSPGSVVRGDQNAGGTQGSGNSTFASLSGDGRVVGFVSGSALDPLDTNGNADVYVRDTGTPDAAWSGAYWSSNSKANGNPLAAINQAPMLSHDGVYVAFYGTSNLVTAAPNVTQAYRAPAR